MADDFTLWSEAHERHDELFRESIFSEDDLGAVIRAEVFIEYYLRRCLEASFYRGDVVSNNTFGGLRFEVRLDLARAGGAELDEHVDAMKKLFDIRNIMAHHVGRELEEGVARDFYNRLSPRCQRDVTSLRQEGDGWQHDFRTGLFVLVLKVRIETSICKARWERIWETQREHFTDRFPPMHPGVGPPPDVESAG